MTRKKLPNGVVMDATYGNRRLTRMVYKNGLGVDLATFSYEHDPIANITKMIDNEGQHTYEYDRQNRLISVNYPFNPANPSALASERFTLDASGNRIQRTSSNMMAVLKTETTTYDAADQIVSVSESAGFGFPMVLKTLYGHDAAGNLTSEQDVASGATKTHTYDVRNRLTKTTLPSGQVVENEYYPDSPLRLFFTDAATGAQTRTVWDPTTQNPLQDLDGTNALVTDYLMGNRIDEPIGRVAGGATHAFLGDHLMTIRGLVDSAGVPVNRYTYAAFGLGRSQVEAVANRLRFTARELDPSTGVQFNRKRHYLAGLGRWTQPDPLGFIDGPNRYAYSRNNPINFYDPTGTSTISIGIGIGRIVWIGGLPYLLVGGVAILMTDAVLRATCSYLDRQKNRNCELEWRRCLKVFRWVKPWWNPFACGRPETEQENWDRCENEKIDCYKWSGRAEIAYGLLGCYRYWPHL